jgi:hypothetical protein
MRKLKAYTDQKQAPVAGHFFRALAGDERAEALVRRPRDRSAKGQRRVPGRRRRLPGARGCGCRDS